METESFLDDLFSFSAMRVSSLELCLPVKNIHSDCFHYFFSSCLFNCLWYSLIIRIMYPSQYPCSFLISSITLMGQNVGHREEGPPSRLIHSRTIYYRSLPVRYFLAAYIRWRPFKHSIDPTSRHGTYSQATGGTVRKRLSLPDYTPSSCLFLTHPVIK